MVQLHDMNKRSLNFRRIFFSFLVVGVALGFASILSAAWTGPISAPPDGNVSSPVNVGGFSQIKEGSLGVNALAVFGNQILSGTDLYLNFGATAAASGYGFRDNGGVMEFKDSDGTWTAFKNLSDGIGDETVTLYNGAHTSADCSSAGGTLKSIGEEDYLCEFSGTSCISGWTQLDNWTSTAPSVCSSSCNGTGSYPDKQDSCSTNSHAFSNTAQETCSYNDYTSEWQSENEDGSGTGYKCTTYSNANTCYAQLQTIGCY